MLIIKIDNDDVPFFTASAAVAAAAQFLLVIWFILLFGLDP